LEDSEQRGSNVVEVSYAEVELLNLLLADILVVVDSVLSWIAAVAVIGSVIEPNVV
jgi:hypothetical protein